jgi:hypothetical protein
LHPKAHRKCQTIISKSSGIQTFKRDEVELVKAGFDVSTYGLGRLSTFAPNATFEVAYDLIGLGVDVLGLRPEQNAGPTQTSPAPQSSIMAPATYPSVSPVIYPGSSVAPSSALSGTRPNIAPSHTPTLDSISLQLNRIQKDLTGIQAQIDQLKANR